MVVARLGPTDGAGGGNLQAPSSGAAPGAAWEMRIALQRHVNVPGEYVFLQLFTEPAMTIGKKVAWWPIGREDVT
eukprot:1588304-Alexandrium_andersonii.AAC.1